MQLWLLYYANMIAPRGLTLVELDHRASEAQRPHGIITVDCSNPYEFDDGIAVTPLPTNKELYKVDVFAVDASSIYHDGEAVKRAVDLTESFYDSPKGGPKRYTPMLSRETVRAHDFTKDSVRGALVVSFTVGVNQPLSNLSVGFGQVEIDQNLNYKRFANRCRSEQSFRPYGRAAALILRHFGVLDGNTEAVYRALLHSPNTSSWRRGSDINEAYMVAANHMVASMMRDEDRLAIYRVHDTDDNSMNELMSPKIARFSTTPGPHNGLGLDVYTRVTSPLRRVEDLIMHGLLHARATGRELNPRDHKLVAGTIQRLNQRAAASLFHDKPRLQADDLWAQRRPPQSLAS